MSDLFAMLHSASVMDQETGEVVGMVTGIETVGTRLRVKAFFFEEGDEDEDDPDDGEKEDIPEEEEKVADANINEKIHQLKTGTRD